MNMVIYLLPIGLTDILPREEYLKRFPARMQKADRYRFEADQQRCIGAGLLLHHVFGISEADIACSDTGKPYLRSGSFHFNLSHSGKYAAAVRDELPVGIDIEELDVRHLDLAKEVCTADELDWLSGDPADWLSGEPADCFSRDPAERFFRIWTLKESVMKQCGSGLSLRPKTFSVLPLLFGDSILLPGASLLPKKDFYESAAGGVQLYGKSIRMDDYVLSVCCQHPIDELKIQVVTENDLPVF